MPILDRSSYDIFSQRRSNLLTLIQEHFPEHKGGKIFLVSAFEKDCTLFRQERSFYYYTGIEEPASSCIIDCESNKSLLYIPNFGNERQKWILNPLQVGKEAAQKIGFDNVAYAGCPSKGYQCNLFFADDQYENVIKILSQSVKEGAPIFTLNPSNSNSYNEQRFILQRLMKSIPGLSDNIIDISMLVARQRRHKTNQEIELMYKAINITMDAHYVAARSIVPDMIEYELQALVDYVFLSRGGLSAFPSIVAGGKNGTVLHYSHNNNQLKKDELVVLDIGAEYSYYCADLTRTYPISGVFNKKQRDIYTIVLEAQRYIADLAKPGYWLSNNEVPEKSLQHLAQKFIDKKGYGKYFNHGIGHFLGLDVHDVGNTKEPLKVGDVITIEPGIYIPQEGIGIRIEDNYWILSDGALCLSEDLPKNPDDIEDMMQEKKDTQEHEEE